MSVDEFTEIDIADLCDHPEELGTEHFHFVRVPEPPPIGVPVALVPKYSGTYDEPSVHVVVLEELMAKVGYSEIDWAHGFIGINPDDGKLYYGYAVMRLSEGMGDDLVQELVCFQIPPEEIEYTFMGLDGDPIQRTALEDRVRALFSQMRLRWVKEE